MQEATRRQYLALLGIETWLPRDQAEEPVVPAAQSVEPAPTKVAGVDALSCSLLALPGGLLLLAAHLSQAPGLSGPEHALLANIAAALAPGASLPATTEFHWPPRGVRLPVTARGGTVDALVGLLGEQRRRQGLQDLLVLGEDLARQVQPVAERLGLTLVAVPALAAMLADPVLKRACWDTAKPLRRG